MKCILFAALLVSACATTSQQEPSHNNVVAQAGSDNLVCVDQAPTGSLITHKICHTPEEWQAEHDYTLQFMQHPHNMPTDGHR